MQRAIIFTLLILSIMLQACTRGGETPNVEKREVNSAQLSIYLSSEESNLLLFFRLRAVEILNDEGEKIPLSGDPLAADASVLSKEEFLLWEGWLPTGGYKALILHISEAKLIKDKRKYTLMPTEELTLPINLDLKTRESSLLFLRWDPNTSIKSRYLFEPTIHTDTRRSVPSTILLYVSHGAGNNITLVDKVAGTVVGKISVGSRPRGMAVSSDGKRVFVANSGERTISVIETSTRSVINVLRLKTNVKPLDLGVSPDGETIYAINEFPHQLAAIDATTGNPIADIVIDELPINLIVSPTGERIFVATRGTNSLSVFDAANLKLIKTFNTGAWSQGLAFNETGDLLFVSNKRTGTISVIDVSRLTLVNTFRAGISLTEIAHDRAFNRLYIIDEGSGSLITLNLQLGTVISSNKIRGGPIDIVIDDGLRKAFVLCENGSIVIINLPAERIYKRVWISKDPYEVALPTF